MVGTPSLVRTVDEKPFYWKVPVVLNEKVIGFIDVKMNGKIPRYGCMGCLYSPYYDPHNMDNCPSTVTISTVEEAKELAKNITDKYSDAVVSEPIYVYDDTQKYYAEILKNRVDDVKFLYNDGFQELNRTLYYSDG